MKKKKVSEFNKYLKSKDGDRLTLGISEIYDDEGFEILFGGREKEKRFQNGRKTNQRWFNTWEDMFILVSEVLSEPKKRKKK